MKKRGNNKENQNPIQSMYQVTYIVANFQRVVDFVTDVIEWFK